MATPFAYLTDFNCTCGMTERFCSCEPPLPQLATYLEAAHGDAEVSLFSYLDWVEGQTPQTETLDLDHLDDEGYDDEEDFEDFEDDEDDEEDAIDRALDADGEYDGYRWW
jgi:hypothetical protein